MNRYTGQSYSELYMLKVKTFSNCITCLSHRNKMDCKNKQVRKSQSFLSQRENVYGLAHLGLRLPMGGLYFVMCDIVVLRIGVRVPSRIPTDIGSQVEDCSFCYNTSLDAYVPRNLY